MASRYLNNIRINDAYTFPNNDGSDGQAIVTDGAGNLSFGTVAAGTADSALKITLRVKNVSGGTLDKGTVVRVATTANPPAGNVLEVDVADNTSASTMPAVGVLIDQIADDAEGDAVAFGRASGFSTSGFSVGDTLYVNTSGDFTTTKPTGTSLIQRIGQVIKVHSSNGSIEVFGAGRANDVPNLPVGKIWVGTASNTDESTVIHLDETNNRLGINDTTPGVTLDITGTDAIKIPAGTEAERPTGVAGMLRYNSDDAQFEGYTTEWGAIAGSGGGGGTVTIEKNIYSGDGVDTTFDTTSAIVSENNVQVYIDGVYQSKDNYTTSGSTVTFSTPPPNGVSVELIHMVSINGIIATDEFTGDNSTTAFVLSMSITNKNNVQVYLDGVYQSKNNYTTSGSTVTFLTAPPNGVAIEVNHIKAVDVSSLNKNIFTGNGSTTDFTLSQSIDDENKTFVFIQGVYQEKSTYSISGTTLTFITAPQNGYTIEVMAFSTITIGNQTVTSFNGQTGAITGVNSVNGQTGAVAISTSYSVSVISSDTTAVANTLYVLTATLTLTLPASPNAGDSVKISNRSGVATATIARNGEKIMGVESDLTLDKLNSGFEMIYSGSAEGWVLIGVEGTA